MEPSHEHPARPQQAEHGFDDGQQTRPEDPGHQREGRVDEGQA